MKIFFGPIPLSLPRTVFTRVSIHSDHSDRLHRKWICSPGEDDWPEDGGRPKEIFAKIGGRGRVKFRENYRTLPAVRPIVFTRPADSFAVKTVGGTEGEGRDRRKNFAKIGGHFPENFPSDRLHRRGNFSSPPFLPLILPSIECQRRSHDGGRHLPGPGPDPGTELLVGTCVLSGVGSLTAR